MSTTAEPRVGPATPQRAVRRGIVDTDVHPVPRGVEEIKQFLPMPWREMYAGERRAFYNNPVHGSRLDSVPPDGGPKGSDPDFLRLQLMETYGVSHPILVPRTFCNIQPDPDYGSAIAAAFNEWLMATWLTEYNHDGAFKGSITINHHDPQRAVEEIEKWAGHPHIVQVVTDSGARFPFGQRFYHPIYEACQRHGLPLAVHPGTDGMGVNIQPTPGMPTHYIEWHCSMSLAFQSHLVSLLTEGVFERFPGLRMAFLEGGVAWLPPLMWRLDAYWKALRREIPWVRKAPSEYLRDHVRLASQPLERPANDKHLLSILDAMDAEHILMFSSDYPHWDFDSPTRAFPKLPDELWRKIFVDNASSFYGLPT
ncbi:amidohydrolase family protein [Pseudonocardia sp.]|uniref:amidohydrolase family protein n=1 Tax=Pseudonocardia sp. TaxID=60912 RepID=UPI002634FE81|nr:amidohydrolase family protein [Pseudonocardia sp.]